MERGGVWDILQKKQILLARIRGIDLEKELQTELEAVLDNEEFLWKQKSKKDWLALRDPEYSLLS